MLENLKTETYPEGMGPHLDKPFVCVVDTGNESAPCNSDLHRHHAVLVVEIGEAGGDTGKTAVALISVRGHIDRCRQRDNSSPARRTSSGSPNSSTLPRAATAS